MRKRFAQQRGVISIAWTERISENSDPGGAGIRLLQKLGHLGVLLVRDERQPGYIPDRMSEIAGKLEQRLLACGGDHYGDGLCSLRSGPRCHSGVREEHVGFESHQFSN